MRSAPSRSVFPKPSRAHRRARAPQRRWNVPVPRHRPSGGGPVLLRSLGIAILLAGWLGAALLLARAAQSAEVADAVAFQIVDNHVYPLTIAESRRERQIVQRLGGDFGVWLVEFDAGLDSLLRPPRLPWTLLVLSTALGLACLHFARLSEAGPDE